MNAYLYIEQEYKKITLIPSYEGVHALLADIYVHLFDEQGALIDSKPVRRGKSTLAVDMKHLPSVHVAVSPYGEDDMDEPMTLEAARNLGAFVTPLTVCENVVRYKLPQVPEELWRWWVAQSFSHRDRDLKGTKSSYLIW